MKIGKDFSFEAAHRLQRHDGKCRNLHGHSYRVYVTVEGSDNLTESGPETGMLFDFGVLSEWWKPLDSVLDHTTILEEGDPLVAALTAAFDGMKVTLFPWPPTAEHLSIWLRDDLEIFLEKHLAASYNVHVRVYETAKSWAEM